MSWHSRHLVVLLCAVAGCGGGDDGEVEDEGAQTETVQAAAPVEPLTTPAAVGVLNVMSVGAAQAAAAALPSVTTGELRRLLAVVRSDHEALQKELAAISDSLQVAAVDHPAAMRVRAASQEAVSQLAGAAEGAGADQAVLQRQIQLHTTLLAVLDSTVLPGLEPSLVAEYARAMRPAVAAHLQRAHQIEVLLRQRPAPTTPTAATPTQTTPAPSQGAPAPTARPEPAVIDTTPPPPPPDTTGTAGVPISR